MRRIRCGLLLPVAALFVGCAEREVSSPEVLSLAVAAGAVPLSPLQEVGKAIYFDENLSKNNNQSCASCHDPAWGFTGPTAAINAHGAVYEGSDPGLFGNRKPPSAAYATPSPVLFYDGATFVGGNFWDGRATGLTLGSPAAEQALGPFLNPLEQALPSATEVVSRVCASAYGDLFKAVWGTSMCAPGHVAEAYEAIGLSVAAFEDSPEVNAFSSKYDAWRVGAVKLTPEEFLGVGLFLGKGKCAKCHVIGTPGLGPALFTDFTFDNLGIPRNPENPFYDNLTFNPLGDAWIDDGLGGFLQASGNADWEALAPGFMGQHKVPTLRNVDRRPAPEAVKAYGHNGYFKSLEQIVHFYNTRDVKPACPAGIETATDAIANDCWPSPEVPMNVNTSELGNLKLKPREEAAIVAFMRALSDGYF
jgi:cytochrome c peroxidase